MLASKGIYHDNYQFLNYGLKFVSLYETRIGGLRPMLEALGLQPTEEQLQRKSTLDIDKLSWFDPNHPQKVNLIGN